MKKLFISSLVLVGLFSNAQEIGNSPYASFGIGDVKYDNTIENASMGGISTAYMTDFNNSFNFANPAANKNLELTSIKLEGTSESNFFKSNYNNISAKKHSSYLSNISIAFPLSKKLKFGVGYQPYSSKNYSVFQKTKMDNGIERTQSFTGKGSVNTLQTGLSYNITPEIGVGLRTNYYFGNVKDIDEITYSDAELINGHETNYKVRHFNFTLGAIYQKSFLDEKQFTIGATTTLGSNNNIQKTYTNSTYLYIAKDKKVEETIIEKRNESTPNIFPMEASLGVGYGENSRWFLSTQVDYKKGKTASFNNPNLSYKDAFKYTVGGWIIPDINNFRSYFSRVIYRYGAFYEQGNILLNNQRLNKWGLALGATFPFKKSSINRMSGIDIGIELGKRGTVENNLIRQNFINLKIGLNFTDKWFRKTKYD
ncbi:MAG: hypothetical protein CSA38_03565 [Flavobacteriales bacterium]|nr:MAG: hypothetical protein CSA38_03565 [Flavobacteriales bacterium]